MKSKPVFFSLLSLIHFGLIFWIPVQVMHLTGMKVDQLNYLPKFLNSSNTLLILMFTVSCWSLKRMDKYTPMVLTTTTVVVLINNHMAQQGNAYKPWLFDLSSLIYLVCLLPAFLGKNFRAMVDRNFQWWKNDPRKQASLKVKVFANGDMIELESFDISKSGIFLQEFFKEAHEGEEITLEVKFKDNQSAFCRAKVIRKCQQKGIYPQGSGLTFTSKPYFFEKALSNYLEPQMAA
jgi:hypothetical protein